MKTKGKALRQPDPYRVPRKMRRAIAQQQQEAESGCLPFFIFTIITILVL